MLIACFTNAQQQSTNWPVLKTYDLEHTARIAMPVGGIGTGTVSLSGYGALIDLEIMSRPAKGYNPQFEKVGVINRTPFFAICVAPGKSETPICGMDYFPTLLDLANIKDYTGILDGKSLLPLWKGERQEERALFWHLASAYKNPPCSIIRKGKWKLIQFLNDGKVELYNLEDDLKESKNLAIENKPVARDLLNELITWRKENKVPLPPASILEF